MPSLSEQDIRSVLEDVIRPDDEAVWLSCGLWTFAHRLGWPIKEMPGRLLGLVLDVLGPERTLILSSYSFAYAKSRVYDLVRTRPETGVIPQTALRHPAFRRTPKPIHNYLVAGRRAAEIVALPCTTAWNDDGVMGWVEKNNARLCMLGVPWHEGCSFFHRAEAVAQVPYRYFKRFPGQLLLDGSPQGSCEETMFVRSLSVEPTFDWARIRERLPSYGEVLASRNPLVFAESSTAAAVHAAGLGVLQSNPYGLLTNPGVVRDWVAQLRDKEIADLAPADRSPFNT